jgi:Peptidase propeptide and YPEB domain
MNLNRKVLATGAAIVALAAGGVGIAQAVGGDDSEEQVSGPSADRARAAALEAVGGGTVTSVEREDGDGRGAFEVEVRRADGSQVEVAISDRFQDLGTAADDDTGSGSDDGGGDDN